MKTEKKATSKQSSPFTQAVNTKRPYSPFIHTKAMLHHILSSSQKPQNSLLLRDGQCTQNLLNAT